MLTPAEFDPPFAGDVKLVDVEDGDRAEVTLNAATLGYYRKVLAAYCNELKEFCTRRGAVYALARSDDPVEALVLKHLRQRGMLG
jgi:hypothetical protein